MLGVLGVLVAGAGLAAAAPAAGAAGAAGFASDEDDDSFGLAAGFDEDEYKSAYQPPPLRMKLPALIWRFAVC